MLCEVEETNCAVCDTPLTAIRGVDESPHWDGKVRSQWHDDPIEKDTEHFGFSSIVVYMFCLAILLAI